MNLYKYISSEEAVKKITSGNLKFATLENLNDPTELLPKYNENEIKGSLFRLRKYGYTQEDLIDLNQQEVLFRTLSPETMVIKAPSSIDEANRIVQSKIYDNQDYLRQAFEKTIQLMSIRCGIFCVSTRCDSLPMWAHYSNNAEGFAIEFNKLDKLFCGDETGILNKLESVKYTYKRSGVTFERGTYKSLFFEKDIDWSYENEKRVITDLSSCEKQIVGNEIIYIKRIEKEYIARVIFGWKIKSSKVKKISDELKKINPAVECVVAKVNEGKIRVPDST